MKLITGLLIFLLLLLQFRLWISDDGLPSLLRLYRSIEVQKQQNLELAHRNQLLLLEVQDLKSGVDALEERARSDLGMIKRGETFFQIIERDDN